MTKNELRYQGTELQLMDAFSQAILQRPLDRITVTGLAEDAGISKAAFYLHYRDVHDLAETFAADYALDQVEAMAYRADFVRDPQRFAAGFLADLARDGIGTALVENGLEPVYLDELTNDFIDALCADGLLPEQASSSYEVPEGAAADGGTGLRLRMTAHFVFHGLVALAFRYADHPAEFAQVAGTLLQVLLAGEGLPTNAEDAEGNAR